jgi:hypothetical protein
MTFIENTSADLVTMELVSSSLTDSLLLTVMKREVTLTASEIVIYNSIEKCAVFNLIIEIFHECK